jgi:hypothetical protein
MLLPAVKRKLTERLKLPSLCPPNGRELWGPRCPFIDFCSLYMSRDAIHKDIVLSHDFWAWNGIWDVQCAAWLYWRKTDSIWDQMVGFCSDGAPSITGWRTGQKDSKGIIPCLSSALPLTFQPKDHQRHDFTSYFSKFPVVLKAPFMVGYPWPADMCEDGFSALVCIKTRYRSRLDVTADMRCALSTTPPWLWEARTRHASSTPISLVVVR